LDKRSAVLKENSQKVLKASLNRAFSPGLLDAGKAFDGKEMGKSSGKAITLDPLVHDDVDGDGEGDGSSVGDVATESSRPQSLDLRTLGSARPRRFELTTSSRLSGLFTGVSRISRSLGRGLSVTSFSRGGGGGVGGGNFKDVDVSYKVGVMISDFFDEVLPSRLISNTSGWKRFFASVLRQHRYFNMF